MTGKDLKFKRIDLGVRQIDLAAAIGKSEAYISRIESGRIIPSPEMWERLTQVLPFVKRSLWAAANADQDPETKSPA